MIIKEVVIQWKYVIQTNKKSEFICIKSLIIIPLTKVSIDYKGFFHLGDLRINMAGDGSGN